MTDDPWLYRIDEYLDEDLHESELEELERHLTTCEDCRAEVASYRRLRRLALAAPAVPVPDDLGFRIRRRLAEVLPPPRRRSRILRLLPLAAGAAAAAALLVMILPGGPGPAERPAPRVESPAVTVAAARAVGETGLERTLSDWLLMAENARGDDARVLAAEAEDLDLLPRVRRALTGARGAERRWLRASEDLLVQLENGPEDADLVGEARLVAEVTP